MAKTILIAAGGTGGHVFPALEVARILQKSGCALHWAGTNRGLEAQVVPPENIVLHCLPTLGLRGKSILRLLKGMLALVHSMLAVWRLFSQIQPDVVLGMGGYVSGPVGLVAFLRRVPLVIHEQNACAGTANRILAHLAKRVFCAFPETFSGGFAARVVGNPVRTAILDVGEVGQKQTHQPMHVLILGGSMGARALNQVLPKIIASIPADERPQLKHQTGRSDFADTEAGYAQMGIDAEVTPFIDEMADAYAWADLVICRAGAMSVAELAAAGCASILIPYPHATDRHQHANASTLVEEGGAICIEQSSLDQLTPALTGLLHDPVKVSQMGAQAHTLAKPEAAKQIADWIICQK